MWYLQSHFLYKTVLQIHVSKKNIDDLFSIYRVKQITVVRFAHKLTVIYFIVILFIWIVINSIDFYIFFIALFFKATKKKHFKILVIVKFFKIPILILNVKLVRKLVRKHVFCDFAKSRRMYEKNTRKKSFVLWRNVEFGCWKW